MNINIFERLIALLSLIIISPIIILISLAILIFDSMPLFFIQDRVGLNGTVFKIYKFRTMSLSNGSELGDFNPGDASRVTKIGKILRKYKLDELPQLVNILIGDMSFVGPRPEVKKWVDKSPNSWKKIHSIRPGVTDPASIKYRNEEFILSLTDDPDYKYEFDILPKKIKIYKEYLTKKSFTYDVKVIIKTLIVLIK